MVSHQRPRALLVLTLATIATALATGYFSPRRVAILPAGFQRPVLAIELVESPAQFRTIAEQPTIDPPGYWASTLLWRGTAADLVFVAVYGLLWLHLLILAGGRKRKPLQYVGITCIVAAVAADYVENWGIIHGLHAAVAPADVIRSSATVKWLALGVVFLALVERFWTERGINGRVWRALNVSVASAYGAAGVLVIAGVIGPPPLLEASGPLLAASLVLQIPLFWYGNRYAPAPPADPSFTEKLDEVRKRELEYIVRRRTPVAGAAPETNDVANTLVGLSLSGGGIRSATTNLGILQALSRIGMLPLVDYLSTVSGGGYIGGCLTSLLSVRSGARPGASSQFEYRTRQDLLFNTSWKTFPFNPELPPSHAQGCAPQAVDTVGKKVVAHLRTHGNFLIARRGLLKRDALRAAGHLLTGAVYHLLTALLVLFVAALLLMAIGHGIEPDLQAVLQPPATPEQVELATVTPLGGAATGFVVNQKRDTRWQREFSERFGRAWHGVKSDFRETDLPQALTAGAIATLAVFAFFIVVTRLPAWPKRWGPGETREDRFDRIVLNIASAVIVATVVAACLVLRRRDLDGRMGWIVQPFLVLAGARIASFVLYPLIARTYFQRLRVLNLWSREFRSLWGSFQAMATYGMVAALLFAILPVLAYGAAHVSFWTLLAPAISLVASRLLVAESVGKSAERWNIPRGAIRFLLGLAVFVIVGVIIVEAAALAVHFGFDRPSRACANPFIIALGVSSAALLFLSLAGDINRISPHYFYRDRLLETYLRTEFPAADKRMETFTDTTSMLLRELHGDDPASGPGNTAPYMLISTAINLAGSRDLTRKDRKSGYFLFSKYFCGSRQTGYRATDSWRGGETKLSRAMTISGAAVNTVIGSKTFFAEAFVAAIFNLRLGYWMSNPRTNAGDRIAFWPRYMFQEIFGTTNERTPLVNLSDGGHTGDNVGIYPLLERRCQVIIACDAEADQGLSFGSFTEALRHAYMDLGIDIDIDLSMIRPDAETKLSKSHCAIGRIRYPECPDRPNWLIYLKNSLTGDEPAPVTSYRTTCLAFPHESTADQFFDDAQFESYRALGVHIAEGAFDRWAAQDDIARALRNPQR